MKQCISLIIIAMIAFAPLSMAQTEEARMEMMKQIAAVLDAVDKGSVTSPEVAEETGLSVKHCSAHLAELGSQGLIRRTGRFMWSGKQGGRRTNVWERLQNGEV